MYFAAIRCFTLSAMLPATSTATSADSRIFERSDSRTDGCRSMIKAPLRAAGTFILQENHCCAQLKTGNALRPSGFVLRRSDRSPTALPPGGAPKTTQLPRPAARMGAARRTRRRSSGFPADRDGRCPARARRTTSRRPVHSELCDFHVRRRGVARAPGAGIESAESAAEPRRLGSGTDAASDQESGNAKRLRPR